MCTVSTFSHSMQSDASKVVDRSILKIKAVRSTRTLIPVYQTTRHHMTEYSNIHSQKHEKFKAQLVKIQTHEKSVTSFFSLVSFIFKYKMVTSLLRDIHPLVYNFIPIFHLSATSLYSY